MKVVEQLFLKLLIPHVCDLSTEYNILFFDVKLIASI